MADIPSTSITLFRNTTPPTGWTKVTTYNDYALRISTGTVGTGGSLGFSSVFTSIIPTGIIGTAQAVVGDVTLDTTMIPSHSHTGSRQTSPTAFPNAGAITNSPGPINRGFISPPGIALGTYTSVNAGGGLSHTHVQPMTMDSGSPGFTGSALPMAVKYVDCILAQRN